MSRTIEITVSPTGEIRIEAVGFVGTSCQQATQALEQALGTRKHFQPKPEYHRQSRRSHHQRLGV
jgi:hypothetical protein